MKSKEVREFKKQFKTVQEQLGSLAEDHSKNDASTKPIELSAEDE